MSIIFLWLVFTILIAVWASNWERSLVLYFFLSIILSPLIAGLILLVVGRGGKKCPECGEMVKSEATICKHCKHKFEVDTSSE